MSAFLSAKSLFLLVFIVRSNEHFPVSTAIETCCAQPVDAFIMREFSGDCACQTLQQKWRRYVDWVEMEGGYVHPFIEMNYVGRYQDMHPKNSPNTKHHFTMHSHERGMFVNIRQKYIRNRTIQAKALMMQIPFSISFSQFIISKYIKNASEPLIANPYIKQILFTKPNHWMPDGFPDWKEFRAKAIRMHHVDSIRGWLALGFAWLRHNTHELLPWLELLPSPYYLPLTWDALVRDEYLLSGTRALPIVRQLEREYNTALPYVDVLGLTKMEVKEAFAWISSRSFGMQFETIGGAKKSPVIPCGIDFFNHNVFGESSIFYDQTFGGTTSSTRSELVEQLVSNKGNGSIREIDFASNYLWINSEFTNTSQIFVNYGKHHTSASRVALFGFMDETHPYDHYPIQIDVRKNDAHSQIKTEYFRTVWNSTYTQNRALDLQMCPVSAIHDLSTWRSLGQPPKCRHNIQNRASDFKVFAPPLHMEYYGQHVIKVDANFLRFLRLVFLPTQHFDSFTINSILNDFEFDYLQNTVDPFVQHSLNRLCDDLLNEYPNTYVADQVELQKTERKRTRVMNRLRWNRNRNMSKTQSATDELALLDRSSLALQYRVREKTFLKQCSKLRFEPTSSYLKSIMKRKREKKRMSIENNVSNQSNGSMDSSAFDILDTEQVQEIWTNLIRTAAMQTAAAQSLLSNTNDAGDEEDTPRIVSIEELMIGKPKEPKQTLAETVGWNSPNVGVSGSNVQQQIVFTGNDGQQLDLSSLFGGAGTTTFTINGGGLQINNGQLIIGDNTQVEVVGNTNANGNNNNQAIPQVVPFSQLMGQGATWSVVSLNQNGNAMNNALNTNNLAQLLRMNARKDKPKAKP
eukprot:547319_1